MEINIRVQMIAAERVDQVREALRDVAVAQVLAHDGTIFGFGLGVVVTVPGARFRLFFNEQLIEQFRDVAAGWPSSVSDARRQLASYFEFYNARRPHSSLGGQTPDTAYFGNSEIKQAA